MQGTPGQTLTVRRSHGGMENFLFSVTVYRDGTIRVNGHGRQEALPEILRMIATALEDGQITLNKDNDT